MNLSFTLKSAVQLIGTTFEGYRLALLGTPSQQMFFWSGWLQTKSENLRFHLKTAEVRVSLLTVHRMERSVNRFEIVNSDGTPDDLKDPKG